MVVSHHAKFQLITMTGSRFFRTVFVEILRPPLLALVPEAGLPISGSDVEAHLKPSQASFGYLPREMLLLSREDFVPTVCCTALKFLLLQQL